jgi:hypothetical protein
MMIAIAVWPATASAAPPIKVTDFLHASFTAYEADGTPHPETKADFDLPQTSTDLGPANTVGLRTHKGELVFIRRLDLKMVSAPCLTQEQAPSRGGDEQQAGDRMGAGDSKACFVQ